MRFISHASSSAGNLYEVISNTRKRLIIDPGISWKKVQRYLKYDLSRIEGVLCGHHHLDHSKSAEKLLEAGIDLFASQQTLEKLDLIDHRKSHIVTSKESFPVGKSYRCFAFSLEHDADGTLGFLVEDTNNQDTLFYANDTSYIKYKFAVPFSIIAIACNYDIETLQGRVDSGDINKTYAKRLLNSHMERQVTKAYIRDFCNLSKCTEIHLLHTSENNADAEKIRKEFEDELFVKTLIAGLRQTNCMVESDGG